ncbi:TolB-like translocation protein; signal peptide [Virgisporangium aliadipatigenens]|uniref:TolB-like translocation protein signal peptide n=1 Tax=Virgisporangium aliadipatigenens TaxID=741659 RepID=A0A8J3YIH3_9ACTN|nr:hypothetical protein [Virgisporangium aliadipatigenens]GIJ44556.1 TolB-like translocation protein; signal peptide [Virgisporangium aliadipatigenens]
MSARWKIVALVAVVVLAVSGGTFYVLRARAEHRPPEAGPAQVPTSDRLGAVQAVPHLVFRSTALGEGYGRVALVPLTDPAGARAFAPAACDRIYARPGETLCLMAERGLVTTYRVDLLGADWQPRQSAPLAGLPSRARISRDGSLIATTTFVYGDSYANPGQFSTRTVLTKAGGGEIGELENFTLTVNGKQITAADRNFWGVTFTDDNDAFYATASSGGKTWLVRGSISGRSMVSVREDVECPSLSPDGTRIAFKKHGTLAAGKWRLAVYDLRTGAETLLAEERSFDDQAEWIDNTTVAYGLARTGDTGAATSDVWAVPADGTGRPRVLIPDAWSPAVVGAAS